MLIGILVIKTFYGTPLDDWLQRHNSWSGKSLLGRRSAQQENWSLSTSAFSFGRLPSSLPRFPIRPPTHPHLRVSTSLAFNLRDHKTHDIAKASVGDNADPDDVRCAVVRSICFSRTTSHISTSGRGMFAGPPNNHSFDRLLPLPPQCGPDVTRCICPFAYASIPPSALGIPHR